MFSAPFAAFLRVLCVKVFPIPPRPLVTHRPHARGRTVATIEAMILLVTPLERSSECAAALKASTGEPVMIRENLLGATTLLRTESFRAVVFDHHQIEHEPHETEIAFAHLGAAIPIEVNFAITGTDRLVRDVQAALRRQAREQASARQAAARALHAELNNTLTTLLLQFDSALSATSGSPAPGSPTPGSDSSTLSSTAAAKLRSAHSAANQLRSQLETAAIGPSRAT